MAWIISSLCCRKASRDKDYRANGIIPAVDGKGTTAGQGGVGSKTNRGSKPEKRVSWKDDEGHKLDEYIDGGEQKGTAQAGQTVQGARLFFCGQWTNLVEEKHSEWLGQQFQNCTIRASMPPFNNPNKVRTFPKFFTAIDVPVFGVNILNTCLDIFKLPEVFAVSEDIGVTIPRNRINKVVQSKVHKVHDMIKAARSEDTIAKSQKEAIDRVEAFAKEYETLSEESMGGPDGWEAFLHKHVSSGWQNKLDFESILGLFGFDEEASHQLREMHFVYPDGEFITYEAHSVRWLSKIFAGYGPQVMVTDLVNLIFAMMPKAAEKQSTGKLQQGAIIDMIQAFRDKLVACDIQDLWVPTHLIMDGESDDFLSWAILEYIHRARGTKLEVLVQLPTDPALESLANQLSKKCAVLLDNMSKNADAIKSSTSCHGNFLKK